MLTDLKLRSAKPQSSNYKWFDQLGLFLLVTPTNNRYWRLRYQLNKCSREMALGAYPAMTLTQARQMQAAVRAKVKAGIDPLAERVEKERESTQKIRIQEDTFEKAVHNYLDAKESSWSVAHQRDVRRIFNKELLPTLGGMLIADISKRDVKAVLDRIVQRNALTFVRDVLGYFGIVIRHYNGGTPLSAKELLHLGNRAAIDQVRSRLVKREALLRADRGVYVLPVSSRFGTHAPSTHQMIEGLTSQQGETIVTHGAVAANALGLTTQVPVKAIYLTSRRNRHLRVGAQKVELRHAPLWQLIFPDRPPGEVVRALAWLGPEKARAAIRKLRTKLQPSELAEVASSRARLPTWMAQEISTLLIHG
jgi:hypothetical protein